LVQITHYTSLNNTDHTQVNIHWIYWIETFSTVQDFWATCACLEKQKCPEFTVLNIYFLSFRFLSNLRLPRKQSLPWKLYWNIFYHSEILSNLRLPWKTDCALDSLLYHLSFRIFEQLALALKFFKPGGLPSPPPRTPMSRTVGQIFKLPSNFMQCGARFQHATQTVGKKSPFLAR